MCPFRSESALESRPPASGRGDPVADFSALELFRRYVELRGYVNWSPSDEERLADCRKMLAPFFGELIDDFYDEILRHEETKAVLGGDDLRILRLKQSLAAWLEELFRGPYDVDYVVRRWRVGMRHVEIGLPHVFAVAALSRLRNGAVDRLGAAWTGDRTTFAETLESLNRAIDLDVAIIGEAYERERVRLREEAERFRMQGLLDEERDVNAGLLANAGAVAIILDRNGRVVRGNARFEQLLGAANPSRSQGDWFDWFLQSDDAVRWRAELFARPRRNDDPPLAAASSFWRGDAAIHLHWTGVAIHDTEGTPVAGLIIGNDVTELLDAQRRAAQSERLAAIGQIAAGIAHESRASLHRIGWSVETLEDDFAERPESLAELNRIRRAIGDLTILLDEVREYAAQPVLDCERCRLVQACREAWDLTASRRADRFVEFHESRALAEAEVVADRVRLVQIFRNLFENSLDAAQDPVRIDVDAELLTEPREVVQIRVRDNGPGIGPDKRHRLFEPFFTTKSKGTGLGMAIVRRLVEAHGGTIDVGDASPGAEIVFTLPATAATSIQN
jgi:signal transduction histidine kinase